jgi:hypothetical protein
MLATRRSVAQFLAPLSPVRGLASAADDASVGMMNVRGREVRRNRRLRLGLMLAFEVRGATGPSRLPRRGPDRHCHRQGSHAFADMRWYSQTSLPAESGHEQTLVETAGSCGECRACRASLSNAVPAYNPEVRREASRAVGDHHCL